MSVVNAMKESGIYSTADDKMFEKSIRKLLDFFRNYADKYHHHKEEQILFPEMVKKNEMLEDGAIKEMFENHEDFRSLLNNIEDSVNIFNYNKAHSLLQRYAESLLDHIAVEDDEVFQMMDTLFSPDELDKIYFRFQDIDNELGLEEKHRWENVANTFLT